MGIFSLLGMAGSLAFNLWGMSKEEEQQQKMLSRQKKFREEDIAREEKWLKKGHGLERGRLSLERGRFGFEKKQAKKQWEWMEEGRNFDRGTSMVQNFMGLVGSEPALQNQLQSTWRTR